MDTITKISFFFVISWICNVALINGAHISNNTNKEYTYGQYQLSDNSTNVTTLLESSTEPTVESRAVKNDPWQGYYDFIINEGSFKFWAVFQVATALLLIYSALAAVYYAKYNFIQPDYDYGDYFFGREDSGSPVLNQQWTMDPTLFQRIMDAISSEKFT